MAIKTPEPKPVEQKTDQPRTGEPKTEPDEAAQAVQAVFDDAEKKGYLGVSPDPTPRENYSVGGVTSGAPTPETDRDAKAAADDPEQTR